MRLDHLEFGTEYQLAICQYTVKEGLDAEPVPGEKQAAGIRIVQGKGEHTAETLYTALTPGLPGIENDLGVTVRAKVETERFQLTGKRFEVVDFPVIDNTECVIRTEHGLLPTGQINNGQPAVSEADPRRQENTALIRAAMKLGLIHGFEQSTIRLGLLGQIKNTGNATHSQVLSIDSGGRRQPRRSS